MIRLPVLALVATVANVAQESEPWHDPSPHKVQFITVQERVQLEVLDWGGSGRPIVLLAGGGFTAHVFDVRHFSSGDVSRNQDRWCIDECNRDLSTAKAGPASIFPLTPKILVDRNQNED
jgi:hypothetical protein